MLNISSYTLEGRVIVANLKMGGVISPGEGYSGCGAVT